VSAVDGVSALVQWCDWLQWLLRLMQLDLNVGEAQVSVATCLVYVTIILRLIITVIQFVLLTMRIIRRARGRRRLRVDARSQEMVKARTCSPTSTTSTNGTDNPREAA
jgi:hypothetical protein